MAWLLYQLDPDDAAPNPASNVKGPGADEVDGADKDGVDSGGTEAEEGLHTRPH